MRAKIELLFIPVVFALTIFVQCVLFHYLIYKEILLSSLWHSPIEFFRFYLPAATMAVFFSSFVFLFKNKWWTVVVSIFFNLWIWANLWYYRANGILIDKYAVSMIGNLNGFWDSILALIRPADFVFLSLSILLATFICIFKGRGQKSIITFAILIILSIVMGLTNGCLLIRKYDKDWSYIKPFNVYDLSYFYVNDHSICHYLIYTTKDLLFSDKTTYTFTQDDIEKAKHFINTSNNFKQQPKTPLLLCIIESFNSFVLTEAFMPNLYNLTERNQNILYVPNIVSQEKIGASGDGQMIIQTGLLPLNQGVACMRFASNKYPAISSLYNKSAGIFPGNLTVWNQYVISPAYGIDTSIVHKGDDITLTQKAIELTNHFDNVMMLTLAMHLPCNSYSEKSSLNISDTVPTLLANYIKSSNYTDMGLKYIVDGILKDSSLVNFTVIITGDHKLPTDEDFGNTYGYSRLIPLIIYSPEIKQKTIITDTCYQMDIYPTILHLIGCEDYYWKGFGVNLLDSAARHNRPITPEEAYDLSDKIIRADYFRKFEEQ